MLSVILHLDNAHDAYKIEWELVEVFLLTDSLIGEHAFLIKVRGKIERKV